MDSRRAVSRAGFLREDGSLKILRWANSKGVTATGEQLLSVDLGELADAVANSPATGQATVSNEHIGADIIRLEAGTGFVPHTHTGDHLLIVIGGSGTITYNGCTYPTEAGQIYLIEGQVPHSVSAVTDHVILAVGSPHRSIVSKNRMAPTDYESLTGTVRELRCSICDLTAILPQRLHELGCTHCPCETCSLAIERT